MLSLLIPILLTLSTLTSAIFVEPASPQCADLCGNSLSSTSGTELTCNDAAYAASQYGATFKACLQCELNSTYYDPVTRLSDLHWALYNLRYAISWCLFGFGNSTGIETPCITSFSCGPLESAFEYDSLNPNASSYSYCPIFANNAISIPKCSSCLQQMGNEDYLANSVTALAAACQQQPAAGSQISIAGNVFSSQVVNITTPSAAPISTYTPSSGLTLGAKIGIAVGGIIVILVISGFCIVWNGKRRRRRVLAEKARATGYEWQAHHGSTMHTSPLETADLNRGMGNGMMMGSGNGGPFFDSPQSQRPLFSTNAWGQLVSDSPVSGHNMSPEVGRGGNGGGFEPAYFSPYSSQYTSPVSATDVIHQRMAEWPRDQKVEPEDERGERIEMGAVQNPGAEGHYPRDKKDAHDFGIAPVPPLPATRAWQAPQPPILGHPGNGRGPERDDGGVKRGHASY